MPPALIVNKFKDLKMELADFKMVESLKQIPCN